MKNIILALIAVVCLGAAQTPIGPYGPWKEALNDRNGCLQSAVTNYNNCINNGMDPKVCLDNLAISTEACHQTFNALTAMVTSNWRAQRDFLYQKMLEELAGC